MSAEKLCQRLISSWTVLQGLLLVAWQHITPAVTTAAAVLRHEIWSNAVQSITAFVLKHRRACTVTACAVLAAMFTISMVPTCSMPRLLQSKSCFNQQTAWPQHPLHGKLQSLKQGMSEMTTSQDFLILQGKLEQNQQPYNEVGNMLSEITFKMMRSTGGRALDMSGPAQDLRRDLNSWKQGMLDLSMQFHTLQKRFNRLSQNHIQGIEQLISLWKSYKNQVFMMLNLNSCRKARISESAAAQCKQETDDRIHIMLIRVNEASSWFADAISQLQGAVRDEEQLVAGVGSKLKQITTIQEDASDLTAHAKSNLLEEAISLQMAQESGSAAVFGGFSLGALGCLWVLGPACGPTAFLVHTSMAAATARFGADLFVGQKHSTVKYAAAVHNALAHVHLDTVNAVQDTSAVHERLQAEAAFLQSLLDHVTSTRSVVELVAETLQDDAYVAREVVLPKLHEDIDHMLHALQMLYGNYYRPDVVAASYSM